MSTSIKDTQVTFSVLFGKIIAAIAQYLTAAIVFRGKPYTPQALAAVFQAYLQSQADLEAARVNVTAKKQARDAARAEAVALLPSLRSYVAATYGEDSPVFTSFGFTPHKAAQKSTHVKAAAATKATATRKAHEAALAAADAPHAPGAPPAQPPAPAPVPPVKS